MNFIQHYSSSKSNLYEVVGGGAYPRRLLLECGIRWPKIQEALNFDLYGIDACLITHEHQDHCKAVRDVIKAGIDIYSSEGTINSLGLDSERRAIPAEAGHNFRPCDAFSVIPFGINHDAAEPFGYLVADLDSDDILFFAPDSGFIKQRFDVMFSHVAIECSYDVQIVKRNIKDGLIPAMLGKRLLETHADKETTKRYLDKFINLEKCRQIHLLHCSEGNLDKEKTKMEFEKRYFIETVII